MLYESNGISWVDFETGNYDYDVMYIESNISFVDVKELDDYETEFVNQSACQRLGVGFDAYLLLIFLNILSIYKMIKCR